MLAKDADVVPEIQVSRGRVEITSARPLAAIEGYRAMFDLVPDESEDPIELRLVLTLNGEALTETWVYQYQPPPGDQRTLY
jgi:glucans biosynthesis protein